MAKKNLEESLQQMSLEEKQHMAEAFVRYDTAKKTNGDVQSAYNEVRNILKDLEKKYDVTIFVPIAPEEVLIDKITEKMIAKSIDKIAETNPVQNSTEANAQVAPQPSDTHYTAKFESLEKANLWLAQQKNIVVTNMQVDTSRVGLKIKLIRLEYQIAAQENRDTYQLTELKKHRIFLQSKAEKVRDKWQEKNPELHFVASVKKIWSFFLIGGGVGFFRYIKEKYFILFTVKTN